MEKVWALETYGACSSLISLLLICDLNLFKTLSMCVPLSVKGEW